MKRLDLVQYTAVRGDRVVVEDVLAVDPSLEERDAMAEIHRRALACLTNFGELDTDRIVRGRRVGVTWRH